MNPYEYARYSVFGLPNAAAYVGLSVREFLEKVESGAIAAETARIGSVVVWMRDSLDPYVRPCSVVYFVGDDRSVKIGFTTDLWARVTALQTSFPHPLVTHFSFLGTRKEERELHREFAEERIRLGGEWFVFSDRIRSWIRAKREETVTFVRCDRRPAPSSASLSAVCPVLGGGA